MLPSFLMKTLFTGCLLLLQIQQAWSDNETPTSRADYQRIISLSPHITELLFSAGAGDKLIGRVAFSDYPPQVSDIANVGTAAALSIERIIQLQPDLIIAWQSGTRPQDVERLNQLGFHVIFSEPRKLSEIPQEIRRFGTLFNSADHAEIQALKLEKLIETLRQRYTSSLPVRAFYQIWNDPLMTVNQQQFISQAMQLCGARNIFADLPLLAGEVNMESVLQRDPQIILLGGEEAMQKQWQQEWQKWHSLTAVKNQQIYTLNADFFHRATARLIEALPQLCENIQQARLSLKAPEERTPGLGDQ
ncbi:cobalamin-binding protein [Thiomicrorhabdus chilensis]|uniref:cobalamin-binding protein n=1 Tax=Thiomicrorhabdus chilensis TaxID=63656 RepID=UPI00040E2E38|nr:cobalamin-binding protein [Thiomicrorhabdus chilensis]